MNPLLELSIKVAIEAGNEIMRIYHTDFDVEYKKDESPLTLADKNANEIIISFLMKTDIPLLSEEGKDIPYSERKNWNLLWIVDPLDGTKEFIKRNGEFTVNIALVKNRKPVLGVVYAPVLDVLYYGEENLGAYKLEKASSYENMNNLFKKSSSLPLNNADRDYYGIVTSRSHLSPETTSYIDDIRKGKEKVKIVSKGSSLKICMVAEGTADIYPRFAPTSEWDTAAGHAVVLSSGGRIVQALSPEDEVVYNKENILNPWFIVKRRYEYRISNTDLSADRQVNDFRLMEERMKYE